MYTVARQTQHELLVNRSRFLAAVAAAEDEPRAREFLAERRRRHWDASHHCAAFVLGPRGEVRRSNDDGEPAGTGGRPILEALTRREYTDAIVVVTRYFGGVKLGAGPLARAYGRAAREALDAAGRLRLVEQALALLRVDHADAGRLHAELQRLHVEVDSAEYLDQACFTVAATDLERLRAQLDAAGWSSAPLEDTGRRRRRAV